LTMSMCYNDEFKCMYIYRWETSQNINCGYLWEIEFLFFSIFLCFKFPTWAHMIYIIRKWIHIIF
jgi:hypothetical protein